MIRVDPHDLFGLSRAPSEPEIEAAYARLVAVFDQRRWRHDRRLRTEARQWMLALNEARDALLTEQRTSETASLTIGS